MLIICMIINNFYVYMISSTTKHSNDKQLEENAINIVDTYQAYVADIIAGNTDNPIPVCKHPSKNSNRWECLNIQELTILLAFVLANHHLINLKRISSNGKIIYIENFSFSDFLDSCEKCNGFCRNKADSTFYKQLISNYDTDDNTPCLYRGFIACTHLSRNRYKEALDQTTSEPPVIRVLKYRYSELFYFSAIDLRVLMLGYFAIFKSFIGNVSNTNLNATKKEFFDILNKEYACGDMKDIVDELNQLKDNWKGKVGSKSDLIMRDLIQFEKLNSTTQLYNFKNDLLRMTRKLNLTVGSHFRTTDKDSDTNVKKSMAEEITEKIIDKIIEFPKNIKNIAESANTVPEINKKILEYMGIIEDDIDAHIDIRNRSRWTRYLTHS